MRRIFAANFKIFRLIFSVLAAVFLLFSGCTLEIPEDDIRGDIEIYSGRVRLTRGGIGEVEMIVRRNQQLRATSLSGHRIVWSSSDSSVVEVDQWGFILVGQSPHMNAVITAASAVDPSIKAELTLITRALR